MVLIISAVWVIVEEYPQWYNIPRCGGWVWGILGKAVIADMEGSYEPSTLGEGREGKRE